ncbi:Cna B-type domain-containing protein [Vagococcus humatus]|uniref:Collagen-binding protein n=1 Tax=Vagococcus humatus TaxID=1889241 RepID=A0A3S0AY47_9ENTE|nr:Cna B-type domain-containing protein [Vagococcus humatus]RST89834.1 collagen-binding protein [Vagococcus humatus]
MKKKLATYVSLLTMLSSFLIGPINVLAEQLDNPLDVEQVDQNVVSTEKEDDLLNVEQVGVDRSDTAVTDKEVDLTQSDNNHSAEELTGLTLKEKENTVENDSNGLDSEKSNPQQEDYLKEQQAPLPASSEINFDLSVTDYDGKPLDKPVGQWDSFRVNLDFTIPNDSTLKSGSETIIQLPAELLIGDNITDSIKDGTGAVVANVTVDGLNKALTLTYTDYVESHSDIKGNFFFFVRVDTSVVQKEELLKLDIDIDGEIKPFEIEFEGVDYTAPPFSKAGWFLDNDARTIQYYLAVNRSQQAFKHAVVKDSLISPDITYDPDSFVIKQGTWVRNDEDTDWVLVDEKEVTKEIVLSEDKRSFTIDFGDIQQDDHFAVYYKATIADDISVTTEDVFSNKAVLESNDTIITEEIIDTIYKGSGGEAEGARYSIKILKLNEDNQPLGGAVFEVREMSSNEIHGKIETNDAGEGSIDHLLKKDYEITEIKAPEGYKLLDEPVIIKAEDFKSEEPVVEKIVINQKETVQVKGEKVWEDNHNQDGLRPDSIQVQLYADEETYGEPVTLSKDNNWTHTWDNLPKLSNGKVIKYTVKEVTKIPGYTTEITETSPGNVVITNKHVTEKTDITGQKTWQDNHNQDGLRPETITVNLLANGQVIHSQTVSEKDNWQYSFTGLPVYEDGELIIYTVTEDQVPGYTTQIKGYDILNTYRPKKTGLTVTKAWEDNHNQDGLRPDSIQVQLYADEETFGEPVTLSKENNWTHTWDNLPKLSNGKVIKYTVKEVTKIPGYTTEITETSPGNVVITNKHATEKTDITGQKTWQDNHNQDGLRPETITVNLLANGQVIHSQTVSEKDNWQYSFTGLSVYEDGELIIYTVTEDQVPGYTTQIKGYDILNTYRPKKTGLTVTKAWEDNHNQDGLRPDSIQVQLYADEETYGKPVTLSKDNNWTHTWDNLPKLSNGKVIKYTVKEITKVPGYTTEITETSPGNVVITNKHMVKKLTEVPLDEPKHNKPSTPSTPYTEVKNKKALPQTSEKANNWVMLLGLLLIGFTLMMSKRKTE